MALEEGIPAAFADELLRERPGALNGRQAYELSMMAHGDEKKAQAAQLEAEKREVWNA